jgi:hypothetical protein
MNPEQNKSIIIEILTERLETLNAHYKKANNTKKLWKDRYKLLEKQVVRLQEELTYYKKQLNIKR